MSELFPDRKSPTNTKSNAINVPLADRVRPKNFNSIVGQSHLIGDGKPLQKMFETGNFTSMIFWGPPGSGKTTIAHAIAESTDYNFIRISAVESGVKEVKQIIAQAEAMIRLNKLTLLFIDEIHRFNKSQQDALLHAVEKGIIILIGATTENPSFEVNSALLSRCQVYHLQSLDNDDIRRIVEQAISEDTYLKEMDIEIEDWEFLLTIAGGDARTALNALELGIKLSAKDEKIRITRELMETALQRKTAKYDKKGESHYDTVSAFIKSMRGSDPDAALLWLAKMIDSGEDPKFIARRMVIFASEDIGNADPHALTLAVSVFQAVNLIGMPEAYINLAHGVTYLAAAAKSNAAYEAINAALSDVRKGADTTVPLNIRNAPTKLMKQEGYGKNYKYPHSYEGNFVEDNYFPANSSAKVYYKPGNQGREAKIANRLRNLWGDRYK